MQIKGRLRSQLRALNHDDALSLDLELANTGLQDLEITRAWTRLGQSNWREEEFLRFHSLKQGEQRNLTLHVGVLPRGRPACEVLLACMGSDAEEFLLGAQLQLSVSAGSRSVHIEISNSTFAAGAAGVIGNHIGSEAVLNEASVDTLIFDRNEGHELYFGIRGYRDIRARIRRDSAVRFMGKWAAGDKSAVDRPFVLRPHVYLGRDRASGHMDFQRDGRFASLRFYSDQGELQRARSMEVSGRQLRLACRNDRIFVKSIGKHPTFLNSRLLDTEVAVQHGDIIALPGRPGLDIRVHIHPGLTSTAAGTLCLERL